MKKSRFTDEQIAFALRQAEGGTPAKEVCRKLGVSEQAFLPLDAKVRGDGRRRGAQAQAAQGRESEAEATGRRSLVGRGRARWIEESAAPPEQGDLEHAEEADGELLEASADSAVLLLVTDGPLDGVLAPVHRSVQSPPPFPSEPTRSLPNHVPDAATFAPHPDAPIAAPLAPSDPHRLASPQPHPRDRVLKALRLMPAPARSASTAHRRARIVASVAPCHGYSPSSRSEAQPLKRRTNNPSGTA